MPIPHVEFPYIRRLIIPEVGYELADIDLEGADARVVAWDAGDEDLKEAFRKGLKVHAHNAATMFPEMGGGTYDLAYEYFKKKEDYAAFEMYNYMKNAVHGTNYGSGPVTLARTVGWRTAQARRFQREWFRAHPDIKRWHREKEFELQSTGQIKNKLGFKTRFFDRLDSVFTEALAWVPQSTVAVVCSKAANLIRKSSLPIRLRMQVHDSLVLQYPIEKREYVLSELYKILNSIVIPYEDPLIIPWGLATSRVSWGHCEEDSWNNYIN